MRKAALRNLLAHKGRLVLTLLTVMLSAGFVAGTFVFTDTLGKTFTDLFTTSTSDIVVTPPPPELDIDGGPGVSEAIATLTADDLAVVEDDQNIDVAIGDVFVEGLALIGPGNEPVGNPQAPTFGSNWTDDERLTPLRLVDGRGPAAEGEIAIDTEAQASGSFDVGDTTTVVTPAGTVTAEIVGVFRYGTTGNLAGATIVSFDTPTAQQLLLNGKDEYTSISAAIAGDATPEEVRDELAATFGDSAVVQTGEEAADQAAADITDGLGFLNIFLGVFAAISVLVGLFLIFNTFAMLIAQRSRELALFRALGARRSQVRSSILLEAAVIGLVGSVLGIFAGLGLAMGLRSAFDAVGLTLPAGDLVMRPRTVLIALAVGLVATVVAAAIPAFRASRVSPLAALRDDMMPMARSLRLRSLIGAAMLLVSGALAFAGTSNDDLSTASILIGVSFVVALVGIVVAAPSISGPVVRVIGAPFRSAIGRLSVANALRNRRRTALTAIALTLGLAIVSAFGTLAASTTASTDAAIDEAVKADFIVAPTGFFPMAAEVRDGLATTEGVAVVSPFRQSPARIDGTDTFVAGVDALTFADVVNLPAAQGDMSSIGAGQLAIDEKLAADLGIALGDTLDVELPTGSFETTVGAIYVPEGFFSGPVVSNDTLNDAGLPDLDALVYVKIDEGADVATVRASIDETMKAFPTAQIQDLTEFKADIRAQINQILGIIYILLALSLVVALLGIINTMALSVVERTREVGLLRAVGTSRRQLRQMIRTEALIISVFGALLGLVLGVIFGQLLVYVLRDQGLTVTAVPWVSLIVFFFGAAVLSVLAASWPAWRASRMDVLQAIASE